MVTVTLSNDLSFEEIVDGSPAVFNLLLGNPISRRDDLGFVLQLDSMLHSWNLSYFGVGQHHALREFRDLIRNGERSFYFRDRSGSRADESL